MQVAELYTGRMDFDVANLVGELVAAESVPALPVLRYKPSGDGQASGVGADLGPPAAGRRGGCPVRGGAAEEDRRRQGRSDPPAARGRPADRRTGQAAGAARGDRRGRLRRRGGQAEAEPDQRHDPQAGHGRRQASQEGGRRRHPRAAQVHQRRFPQQRLLAPAGQAGRAQGTLGELPPLRRRGRHAGHRLGRLRPPATGPGHRRALRAGQGTGRPQARAAAGRHRATDPLAQAVAQRAGPGLRHPHGRLLRRLPGRGSQGPGHERGRGDGVDAAGKPRGRAEEEAQTAETETKDVSERWPKYIQGPDSTSRRR